MTDFKQIPSISRPLVLAIFAGCLLLSFLVFANTFGHDWTYDDYPVIVDNPDVQSIENFLADSYPGRPLREVTYLVDHALFGFEPAGWHIQSIFWHGLAGFLLAMLMARLGFGWLAGCVAALLFLVHPITVEAVANISHRKESLVLVFSLLALLTYHQASQARTLRWLWLAGSFLLVAIAYQGKQTAAGIPLLMLSYEWCFVERSRWLLLRWWRLLALGAVGMVGAAGYWFVSTGAAARYDLSIKGLLQFKCNYFDFVDLFVYAKVVVKSWAFSASKLIAPTGLAAEYTLSVPQSWLDAWVLAGLALFGLLVAGLITFGRTKSPYFFGLFMAVLFFLPVANLWPLAYLVADRYLYAPWAGLSMLLAVLLVRHLPSAQMAGVLALLVALPLMVMTWQQNRVWSSREALWTHAYQVNPNSAFVLNNMGNLRLAEDDYPGAAGYYQRSLETNPLNPAAWYNLGFVFEKLRRMDLALQFYQQFINLNHSHWRREIDQLHRRLMTTYGVRLEVGPFNPILPRP